MPRAYPGSCRGRAMESRRKGDALRLDMARALSEVDMPISYVETGTDEPGEKVISADVLLSNIGDAVLGRKEIETVSYVLAAVLDDARQHVTHVVRGADLVDITGLQVVLQRLFGLSTPVYHHHVLIRDASGKRLAKRDDARAISTYRAAGKSVSNLRAMVGL